MEEVIILPDEEEIMRRLATVQRRTMHMAEYLFPRIQQIAGSRKNAHGLVMVLIGVIMEYAERSDVSPAITNVLYGYIPDFIEALVDDDEFKEASIAFYDEVIDASENP